MTHGEPYSSLACHHHCHHLHAATTTVYVPPLPLSMCHHHCYLCAATTAIYALPPLPSTRHHCCCLCITTTAPYMPLAVHHGICTPTPPPHATHSHATPQPPPLVSHLSLPLLPSTHRHHCTLHATGRCPLRATTATAIYIPPLPHSRCPRLPPFAATHLTPIPCVSGPTTAYLCTLP